MPRRQSREESGAGTQVTRPPKVPPSWFVHVAWRVHRALYRLSGGRFLWTPSNKRGWGAMRLTTVGRKSGQERSVIIGYLEDGANLGFNCEIFSAGRVRVGKDTLLAAYAYLVGGDHDFSDRSRAINDQPRHGKGIDVGAGVWIGAGATVLDGVTIGDRAIIGASAVVREPVPAGATAVGVPARLVSTEAAT